MDRSEAAELARRLGHGRIQVYETQSSRRWVVECSCGYGAPLADGRPTVTRATFDEAVRTARHHLVSAIRTHQSELRRNGGRVAFPSVGAGA